MANHRHPYENGDIVRDIANKEVFKFNKQRDGYKAEHNQRGIRLATEEEKAKLDESGQDSIKINF